MKSKTFKFTEIFLLISLPVSILVACNGENEKNDITTKADVSVTAPEEFSTKTDLAAFEDKQQNIKKTNIESEKAVATKKVEKIHNETYLEIVKIPNRHVLNFSLNQFSLNTDQKKLIKQHAQYLRYNPNSTLMISGFSDSQGPADLNYALSKKRAKSVYDEFRKLGIVADQLELRAYGEAFAMKTASSYDDRRVELDYVKRDMPTTAMLNQ